MPKASPRALSLVLVLLCLPLALACGGSPSPDPKASSDAKAQSSTDTPNLPGTLLEGEPETPLPIESDDIVSGNLDAPVTIVAFLDYECGFCAQGFGLLAELRGKYDEKNLRIVVKQLPLESHPEALPAAIAAQSVKLLAGDRAALNYSAKLFENQGHLGASAYAVFADELGVPRGEFNDSVASEETIARIGTDVLLARRLGIQGTPAFFVNGKALPGLVPAEEVSALIDEETRAIALLRKTKPAKEAYASRVSENAAKSLVDLLLAEDPATHRVDLGDSPRQGPDSAKVTLVVFSDFECPFCKKAEPTLASLRKIYGDDLRIVFKNLPLPFHKQAAKSARVALAVKRKSGNDAFFAFHDRLFESAPNLGDDRLRQLGIQAGLAPDLIEGALADRDPGLAATLEADLDQSDDLRVRGAPHFFINGLRLSGARPLAQFRALIDEAKRRAVSYEAAHPGQDVYLGVTKDGVLPGAPVAVETLVSSEKKPLQGDPKAKVTIHVWSDFECPYCRKAEYVLEELEKEFPGKLRFVWHDLPLEMHARAEPIARLGQYVFSKKGSAAFFAFHDAVFSLEETAPKLERADLLEIVRGLGLASKDAELALDSKEPLASLKDDLESATKLGIRGTPGFLVGKYLVTGAQPKRHFERLIKRVLLETGAEDSGIPAKKP